VTLAPDRAGLVALDALSQRLLAGARPLRVAVAETAAECNAVLALRYDQVVQDGWARPEDLPDGVERDGHDAYAWEIGAWKGETLVGAMRLVLPPPGRRLPVEEAFDLEIEPHGQVVEAGRLVIARGHRGDPSHGAWGALFARAWLTMRARGLSLLCGAASPRIIEQLRAMGLPFEVIGPARTYWGQRRVPVRLDPAQADPRWFLAD
jgi:N-acyl-L-homoserine lactone synthetase